MSADNGIYVLQTISNRKKSGNGTVHSEPHKVFRVAHAQAIDNFDWYKREQPHNLGAYMVDVWGKSEVFEDEAKALVAAHAMARTCDILEYGVSSIYTDLVFHYDL